MSLKNKIINSLSELPDSEIIHSHGEVRDSINKINDLIPPKFRNYNLVNVIMPKAYAYHTGLDNLYRQYIRLTRTLTNLKLNRASASFISYFILKIKACNYSDLFSEHKHELNLQFNNKRDVLLNKDSSYNLFFASAQTYLRVITSYMNKSENQNILVIPRFLQDSKIVSSVDKENLIFYEDFITEEIWYEYEKAKQVFQEIFIYNQDKFKTIFRLDSKSFYPFIKPGLRNLFHFLLPEAVLFHLINEEILKRIKVKKVIGCRVRKIFDRSFYVCAKNQGIERYVLLHSNIGKDITYMYRTGNFDNINGVFTWGEQQKEIIEKDIFSKVDSFYVTGSPLFERPNLMHSQKSNKVKRILYAATNNDFDEIKELIRFLNNSSEQVHLTIKVHPGKSDENYKLFSKYSQVDVFSGKKVLEDMLPDYDLLITIISESSLQGMLFRIPTLMLQINDRWNYLFYTLYGFTESESKVMTVKNRSEIKSRINKIFFDDLYREKHLKLQDKVLSKRIRLNPKKDGSIKEIDHILQ